MRRKKQRANQEEVEDGDDDDEVAVVESFRKVMPTHFNFKIQSFSMLSKNSFVHLESTDFEAGGYKWKLKVYPEGNDKENGKDHISLYLVMADTSSLPAGWEIKVDFRLFLFNQIQDKYLIRGDMGGGTSRFHQMKMELGFAQFLSLAKFKDPSNGYLVDDTCVFGAEVFVYKRTGNGDSCLSMITQPVNVQHTWKVESFSKIKANLLYSETFNAAGRTWRILLYPKGCGAEGSSSYSKGSLSLYLNLADNLTPGEKVCVDFLLRIRDQKTPFVHHCHYQAKKYWLSGSGKLISGGWANFIKLCDLNDQTKGFLVKDACIIEAEVKVLGSVSQLQ